MKLTDRQLDVRDTILFGIPYDEHNYQPGGIAKFLVPACKIQQLVDDGLLDLTECQNDGPTIEEFLDYVSHHPNSEFLLGGYAVQASREDERVTIDRIQFVGERTITSEMVLFIEQFHWADELTISENWETVTVEAWWD